MQAAVHVEAYNEPRKLSIVMLLLRTYVYTYVIYRNTVTTPHPIGYCDVYAMRYVV